MEEHSGLAFLEPHLRRLRFETLNPPATLNP